MPALRKSMKLLYQQQKSVDLSSRTDFVWPGKKQTKSGPERMNDQSTKEGLFLKHLPNQRRTAKIGPESLLWKEKTNKQKNRGKDVVANTSQGVQDSLNQEKVGMAPKSLLRWRCS